MIQIFPSIHLLHKPAGVTSFSLVKSYLDAVRHEGPGKTLRVCHGGALDPFAQGLLPMLIGPATRLFDFLHDIPKTYQATVRWGIETDNGDPLGKSTFTGDPSGLSREQLDEALAAFVGWREQVPPATSNKRVDGERAYLKAHRGETVEMQPCRVYLHEAAWVEHDLPHQSRLQITVRGGYYVRALARDLGRVLGCGAHLSHLHRTAIGPWVDPGVTGCTPLQGRQILPWARTRLLKDQDVGDLRHGRTLPVGALLPPDWLLPDGFPSPRPLIRGFHRERFCFLLKEEESGLHLLTPLSGGL